MSLEVKESQYGRTRGFRSIELQERQVLRKGEGVTQSGALIPSKVYSLVLGDKTLQKEQMKGGIRRSKEKVYQGILI